MDRLARLARSTYLTALIAAVLAVLASVYLVGATLVSDEDCVGIQSSSLKCNALTPSDAAQVASRKIVILSIVLVFYALCALAARWQSREQNSTAYGLLMACGLTVLGISLPALGGAGFFFAPSTLLVIASMALGTLAIVEANGGPRAILTNLRDDIFSPTPPSKPDHALKRPGDQN